jgi:hypothetical protein
MRKHLIEGGAATEDRPYRATNLVTQIHADNPDDD